MLATVHAPALIGVQGQLITIECDITNGLPGLVIVGLGDKAVEESRERIRSAIKNSGFVLPPKRITLNLAPADLPKDGSGYDLGMALAILSASGQIEQSLLEDALYLGELALNGAIKPTRGILVAAQLAVDRGITKLFVPSANAGEVGLVDQVKVFTTSSLLEVFQHLNGHALLSSITKSTIRPPDEHQHHIPDLSEIYGQPMAKRAVEIATAGGHNLLLTGPPGTGKTLLAKSILKLLPPLSTAEMIEITKIYSLSESTNTGLITQRPFRSPHHTASTVAMIGGGSRPRPGEISLSHGGVLLLDEIPEFPRAVLEVLRQPLEEGQISISRAAGTLTFPARFMLVGTANPCPCGFAGDGSNRCNCTAGAIWRYQRRLSGPLLDRIDIITNVYHADHDALIAGQSTDSSSTVSQRIVQARTLQSTRFRQHSWKLNAHMNNDELKFHCNINNEIKELAKLAMANLNLSARGYMRCLRVARTIADLDGSTEIQLQHFTEALQFRPVFGVRDSGNTTKSLNVKRPINTGTKGSVAQNVPKR